MRSKTGPHSSAEQHDRGTRYDIFAVSMKPDTFRARSVVPAPFTLLSSGEFADPCGDGVLTENSFV